MKHSFFIIHQAFIEYVKKITFHLLRTNLFYFKKFKIISTKLYIAKQFMKENFLRSTILMFMYILFYDLVYAILNPRSLYYFFGINYENVQRFFFIILRVFTIRLEFQSISFFMLLLYIEIVTEGENNIE